MTAPVILITLAVAFIGAHTANASSRTMGIKTFAVGNCVNAFYTAPTTGRVTVNLNNEDGEHVLHVDYRVNWGSNVITGEPWEYIMILNTQNGDEWGPEVRIEDIESTPGMELALEVCAGDNEFTITLNRKEVTTYEYRAEVTSVAALEYLNYEYDSTVNKFCLKE